MLQKMQIFLWNTSVKHILFLFLISNIQIDTIDLLGNATSFGRFLSLSIYRETATGNSITSCYQ